MTVQQPSYKKLKTVIKLFLHELVMSYDYSLLLAYYGNRASSPINMRNLNFLI